MQLHDCGQVIRQKMVEARQPTLGKKTLHSVLQQPQPQLNPNNSKRTAHGQQTEMRGVEARRHVFLKSCSPVSTNAFGNINACTVRWQWPLLDGSLRDEKEHQHVGPHRMAISPVEFLQGRMTSPMLEYREAGVKRQQSSPNRSADDNLLKLWGQKLKDAAREVEGGEARSTTGMSEIPYSHVTLYGRNSFQQNLENIVQQELGHTNNLQ